MLSLSLTYVCVRVYACKYLYTCKFYMITMSLGAHMHLGILSTDMCYRLLYYKEIKATSVICIPPCSVFLYFDPDDYLCSILEHVCK